MTLDAAVRQLLAFLVAKEMGSLCSCGAPATVWSDSSCCPPVCDVCRAVGANANLSDWQDLRTAPAIRALLGGDA